MKLKKLALTQAIALVLATGSALADVTIGVIVSATGPAASLGSVASSSTMYLTFSPPRVAGSREKVCFSGMPAS